MDELSKSLFGGKRIFGAFPLSQELAKEQADARELEKEGNSEGAKKGWEARRGGAKAEEDKPAKKVGQAQGKKKVADAMFEGHKHFRDIKRDGSEDDKKRLHQIANHFGQAADHAKAAGKKALAEGLHGVADLAGWHMGWHVVAPGRKMTDTEHTELSNALDNAGAAYRQHFKKELDDEQLEKDGTSDGAKQGWETRRAGGAASEEAAPAPAKHEVAHEILNQLGGKHLVVMTGAKNLIAGTNGLSFRLPKAGKGINSVSITLDAATDTYDVAFRRIQGVKVHPVSSFDGIHADQLRGLFEDETGLSTSFTQRFGKSVTEKDGTSDGAKKGWETRRGGESEKPAPSRSMARRLAIQREPAHHIEGKKLYDDVMRHIEGFKKYADHEDPKLRSAALGPLSGARNKIEELEAVARRANNKKAEEHFQDARALLEESTGRGGHAGPSPSDAVSEMIAGLDALRGYEARADESGFA